MPHISDEEEQAMIRAMFASCYDFENLPDVVDTVDDARQDLLGVIEPCVPQACPPFTDVKLTVTELIVPE